MKTFTAFLLSAVLTCATGSAVAQSYRALVNEANEAYQQKQYDAAKNGYSKATKNNPDRIESWFNSGNTSYRTDDVRNALKQYEEAGKRAQNKAELGGALYNAGNVFLNAAEKGTDNPMLVQSEGGDATKLRMEGYQQAIQLYKQALKLNPGDADARYNLTYARKKLQELQQQSQSQDQNKDQKQQKQDNNQDQQNQDKSKQDEQQKKDQQDQQQQQQNQKDQQQQEQAKQNQQQQQQKKEQKMSKQQAEQILRALERQEKDLQKEKRKKVPVRIQVDKDW